MRSMAAHTVAILGAMRLLPGQEERQPPGQKAWTRSDAATEQRARILRVTAELVAKRGFVGTKTDMIVKRAHVGYGTFNKFFADKEGAFLALYQETYETYSAKVAEAFGGPDDKRPWADRVAAAIATFYATIASDPTLWRACLVEALTAGPEAIARYEDSIQQLGGILRMGRQDRRASTALPKSLEGNLAGAIVWIAYQRLVLGEAERLPELLPEALYFSLQPYLGEGRSEERW